jgi:dsRNA-specific ribonuclease
MDKNNNDVKTLLSNIDNINSIILNEKNRLITKDYLNKIFQKYRVPHTVNDIKLFEIAMTHSSYIERDFTIQKNLHYIFKNISTISDKELIQMDDENMSLCIQLKQDSYETLEYVGDAILRNILSEYLFCRYSKTLDQGCLSSLRALIESDKSFSAYSRLLGLNKYVLISKSHELNMTRDKGIKMLCDIFESFICALYFDVLKINYSEIGENPFLINVDRGNAYQICYKFIVNLIEDIDHGLDFASMLEINTNYKTRLIAFYQKNQWSNPVYEVLKTKIVKNKKYYLVGVYDNEHNIIGRAESATKKEAEKSCAMFALKHFGESI